MFEYIYAKMVFRFEGERMRHRAKSRPVRGGSCFFNWNTRGSLAVLSLLVVGLLIALSLAYSGTSSAAPSGKPVPSHSQLDVEENSDFLFDVRDGRDRSVVDPRPDLMAALDAPANYPDVFAVSGIGANGHLCRTADGGGSASGPGLNLVTLGCGLDLAFPDGRPARGGGTSEASAVTAAVLTALRSYRPDLSTAQAEQLLTSTAVGTPGGPALNVEAVFLEPLVESKFHSDSYGYRPGKSALDAVGVCRERCWKFDWIIDLDIQKFFDEVPWDLIVRAVESVTDCRWVLLYVKRWLAAPLQHSDGTLVERVKGTSARIAGFAGPC